MLTKEKYTGKIEKRYKKRMKRIAMFMAVLMVLTNADLTAFAAETAAYSLEKSDISGNAAEDTSGNNPGADISGNIPEEDVSRDNTGSEPEVSDGDAYPVAVQAAAGRYEALTIAQGSLNGNAIWGATESRYGVAMDANAHLYSASRVAAGGLPVSGRLTMPSSGVTYYLAAGDNTATAYDGNDCIRLTSSEKSKTMNLDTVGVYQNVYVLATAGGPGAGYYADFSVTLTYTDGTSGTTTYKLYDWYDATPVSGVERYANVLRMNCGYYDTTITDGTTTGGPILHSAAISVDKTKLLKSITFSMNGKGKNNTIVDSSSNGLYCCIFAVTGATPAGVPNPPVAKQVTKTEGDISGAFTTHWTSVSGAAGYYLDVATDRKFTNMVSGYNNKSVGNVTSYTVSGSNISPDVVYYYRVRAVNSNGQSLSSNRVATDLPLWIKNALQSEDFDKITYDAETNTVTFQEDVTLKDTITVPAGDTTNISLGSNKITAPDGKSAISAGSGSNVDLRITGNGGSGIIAGGTNAAGGNAAPTIDFSRAGSDSKLSLSGSGVTGSDGASGSQAGTGGSGILANNNTKITIGKNTTVTGGNGGDATAGNGGNGGAGISGGSVSIEDNGSVTGGNGGDSTSGKGGNGGAGISNGNVTENPGSVTGGNGGNGSTAGGEAGSAGTSAGTPGAPGTAHNHEWNYAASDNVILAYCTGATDSQVCPYFGKEKALQAVLQAEDSIYDGSAYSGAYVENPITDITGAAQGSILYYAQDAQGKKTGSTIAAPTEAGGYVAEITIGGATAEKAFSILKDKQSGITVEMPDYEFGSSGEMQLPSLTGTVKETPDITYYYYPADETEQEAREWKDMTPETLDCGDYKIFAVLTETGHFYAYTTPATTFTVKGKVMTGIYADDVSKTYDGRYCTIQVEGNIPEGAVIFYGQTPDTCTQALNPAYIDVAYDAEGNVTSYTVYYEVSMRGYENYKGSARVTVLPKELTAEVTAENKEYDGTGDAVCTASVQTGIEGQSLQITGITGFFATANAGEQKNVTVDGTAAVVRAGENTKAGNYRISYPSGAKADIRKRPVKLSWSKDSLLYTTGEQTITAEVSNAVYGDGFTLTYAENRKTDAGIYVAEVTALGNDNYTLEGAENRTKEWRISYLSAPAARIEGTKGNADWYTSAVMLVPQNGYEISKDGITFSGSLLYENQGAQKAEYYLRETATGAITDKMEADFKIDTQSPAGRITVRENYVFESRLAGISFRYFFQNKVNVSIEADDATSGVARIGYQKVLKESDFDADGNWTEGSRFTMNAFEKAIVYACVTDEAGNRTILNSDGVVVYEDSVLQDSVTYVRTTGTDVQTAVDIKENTIVSVKNGADIVDVSGYSVENGKIVLKASYLETLQAGAYRLTVSYNPMGYVYDAGSVGDAPAESVINLTVEKAEGSIVITTDSSKEYDGQSIEEPLFRTRSDVGTDNANISFVYKKKGDADSTYSSEAPVHAGTYVVRVTVKEDENYKEASGTTEFTITPRTVGLTWRGDIFTYDGRPHMPDAEATGTLPGDTCRITVEGKQTAAGISYVAEAVGTDNPDYKTPADNTFLFAIEKRQIKLKVQSAEKHIGRRDPGFRFLTENMVEGDKIKGVRFLREKGEKPGTYEITAVVDDAANPNYIVLTEGNILTITGHSPVTDAAVKPTETTPGRTMGSHCAVCGKILVEQEEIPALGHDGADERMEEQEGKSDGLHSPKTGDNTNMAGWTALMIFSLAAFVILWIYKRKNNQA